MSGHGRTLPRFVRPLWPGLGAWLRAPVLLLAALALLLAGCDSGPPVRTVFPPLRYDYLTRLRLNVATIDIDDRWQSPPDPRQVGAYAPVTPVAALRRMALDRLVTGGAAGRAVFTIEDASLLRDGGTLNANLAVRLTVSSADGTRSGYAAARVARAATITSDDPAVLRDALYTIVQQAMDDMNVEFEFQVRRSLRDWLQTTATSAPLPPPVQSQALPPPGIEAAPGATPLTPPPAPGVQPPPPAAAPSGEPPLAPGVQPLVQPQNLGPPANPPSYTPPPYSPPAYVPPVYAPPATVPSYPPPGYTSPAYPPPAYSPSPYSPPPANPDTDSD
jgi:hypothetical protein